VLQQLFDVTALFDMHVRPELVLLQRTMVTVEGVARLLDPEIDMWAAATPVVKTYVNKAIGPLAQAEKLKASAIKAIEIAPKLPAYVETLHRAAEKIAAADEVKPPEPPRATAALWAGAAAILILAAVLAFR